jgi:hypothetical protein
MQVSFNVDRHCQLLGAGLHGPLPGSEDTDDYESYEKWPIGPGWMNVELTVLRFRDEKLSDNDDKRSDEHMIVLCGCSGSFSRKDVVDKVLIGMKLWLIACTPGYFTSTALNYWIPTHAVKKVPLCSSATPCVEHPNSHPLSLHYFGQWGRSSASTRGTAQDGLAIPNVLRLRTSSLCM